jgi:energy-coupling factor transporter ATP-binding protein EcfA2
MEFSSRPRLVWSFDQPFVVSQSALTACLLLTSRAITLVGGPGPHIRDCLVPNLHREGVYPSLRSTAKRLILDGISSPAFKRRPTCASDAGASADAGGSYSVARVRMLHLYLNGHRSVEYLDFEAGPFTVLFGKNNAGKTNILETIYGLFPRDDRIIRRTYAERPSHPEGALVVELEPDLSFDASIVAALQIDSSTPTSRMVAFTNTGVLLGDPQDYVDIETDIVDSHQWTNDTTTEGPGLHVLFLDWQFEGLHVTVEDRIAKLSRTDRQRVGGDWPWLEMLKTEGAFAYRIPAATETRVAQLASLATDLLPDFVDGSISAHVTAPTLWSDTPKVLLEYNQRGLTQCADLIDGAGHGAARWMAAAVQIALHLMEDYPGLMTLRDAGPRAFSGHVLLVDEPEAHLHPSAVASIVRWCHRMVYHGFTVIAASHHEEFLRAHDNVTLVHVTRNPDLVDTSARTLPTATTLRLQDLARDIGLHPAAVLSLRRAILFVEGPLDEAVLDEYGHLDLDAAGVKIVPIHGTKNLEGLVTVEVVTELGIKIGILTDATDTATMAARSGKKRSSEERKVLKVEQIALAKGLQPPMPFGVPEDDMLFALPVDAIREYLKGPFPGWKELVAECREALGKGPSDSVDWKSHALEHYRLPITTPEGVRDIVRKLDLAGVSLPSIKKVIEQVVTWASEPRPGELDGTASSDYEPF